MRMLRATMRMLRATMRMSRATNVIRFEVAMHDDGLPLVEVLYAPGDVEAPTDRLVHGVAPRLHHLGQLVRQELLGIFPERTRQT
eukprot:1545756-Pyramimonas_sp.AAC.1